MLAVPVLAPVCHNNLIADVCLLVFQRSKAFINSGQTIDGCDDYGDCGHEVFRSTDYLNWDEGAESNQWPSRIPARRATPAVAVGGPIVDYNYSRLRDRVVYFLEDNGALPTYPKSETFDLNDANIAYRRDILVSHRRAVGALPIIVARLISWSIGESVGYVVAHRLRS